MEDPCRPTGFPARRLSRLEFAFAEMAMHAVTDNRAPQRAASTAFQRHPPPPAHRRLDFSRNANRPNAPATVWKIVTSRRDRRRLPCVRRRARRSPARYRPFKRREVRQCYQFFRYERNMLLAKMNRGLRLGPTLIMGPVVPAVRPQLQLKRMRNVASVAARSRRQ